MSNRLTFNPITGQFDLVNSGGAFSSAAYILATANAGLVGSRLLAGTANQVIVTDGGAGGSITLSLPQNIHTGATPTFAGLTLTQAIATSGSPTLATLTTASHTTLANADLSNVLFDFTNTVQFTGAVGGTTITNARGQRVIPQTYSTAGAGALSIINGYGLVVEGAPQGSAANGGTTIVTSSGISVLTNVLVNVTTGYAMTLASPTGATTNRTLLISGTGVNNSIVFGSTVLVYANATSTLRLTEATNARGLDIVLSTTNQTINTTNATTSSLILQNQTFTPAAAHNSVLLSPTYAAESQSHTGFAISVTQNGASTNSTSGMSVLMTKATVATTLATMVGINFLSPVVSGTVSNSSVITIASQTNASITTPRGIIFSATGVANSILWGGSALQFANAANNMRFADSTNAEGIDLSLAATGAQTLTTFGTGADLNISSATGIVAMISARHAYAKGANVASPATNSMILGTDGNVFTVTGTNTINAIATANWQSGSLVILVFSGALTVKHNTAGAAGTAVILLGKSLDFLTAANSVLGIVYDGTQWQEVFRKVA